MRIYEYIRKNYGTQGVCGNSLFTRRLEEAEKVPPGVNWAVQVKTLPSSSRLGTKVRMDVVLNVLPEVSRVVLELCMSL